MTHIKICNAPRYLDHTPRVIGRKAMKCNVKSKSKSKSKGSDHARHLLTA